MKNLLIISHQDCLLKHNGINHPERRGRLDTILNSLKKNKDTAFQFKEAPLANLLDITLVHPREYMEYIFSKIPKTGLISVEEEPYADTFLCPNSKNAILRSCGAGILAADNLMNNNINRIFCAVRPPGHHAETARANGFCFINNVAVTARYLQKKYKIKKIAIIDFDVHHGNGTQEIFYNDETVVYGSIHQFPLFPGTGSEEEKGMNNNIFNAPINSGTNSKKFLEIFEHKILNPINKFKPEIVLLSAGFDAHKRDPLSQINLESSDFNIITNKIIEIANIHTDGKIISFLEGGYDLIALEESVNEHLRALTFN